MTLFLTRLMLSLVFLSAPYFSMEFWLSGRYGALAAVNYGLITLASLVVVALVAGTCRRFFLLHTLIFAATLVFLGYVMTCNDLPGYPIALVLETASWEEVRGFFGSWQEQRLLVALVIATAAYIAVGLVVVPNGQLRPYRRSGRRIVIGALGLLAYNITLGGDEFMRGAAATPIIGTALFLAGPIASANAAVNGVNLRKRPFGATRDGGTEVHILIVGESSRRNSWSVYGYPRPTTPFMQAIKDEAVFLDNVKSDANVTVYAVPILLTGMDPESFSPKALRGNLVDLAREAGYYTVWLANQDASISYLVGMAADTSAYSITVSKPSYVIYPPDGVLLAKLAAQLRRGDSSMFIGLHVFGSHSPYSNRYPQSFARFDDDIASAGKNSTVGLTSDRDSLNSYDDSILYTDWFIHQVIEQVRLLSIPVTVTYVSDHGEEIQALDGRTGHGLGSYSPRAFEIPAFVWMNGVYRRLHPDKEQAVAQNARKRIRSHDFFYTLADLMGIKWPEAIPQRSFASPSFSPDLTSRFFAGGKLVEGD